MFVLIPAKYQAWYLITWYLQTMSWLQLMQTHISTARLNQAQARRGRDCGQSLVASVQANTTKKKTLV